MTNYQIVEIVNISEPTIIKVKKDLIEACRIDIEQPQNKLSEIRKVVQVDETAICRGRLILQPTSSVDNIPGTTWMLGITEESTENRGFTIEIVANRTSPTISEFFENNIYDGTIIKSDGYPSYPRAYANNNLENIVVNHSEGFTNADGDHTNIIMSLWSHFKTEMRIRRGVMRENMSEFAVEFAWKVKILKKKKHEAFGDGFLKILNIIFSRIN